MASSVTVDVVVVGGGSCGSVVASRLSEDSSRSVLLLEAGPAFTSLADYPPEILDASRLPIGPASPWVGVYPATLTDGVPWTVARGRVLGGSGAVNGGYFMRALPGDFDTWPQALWSWEQVLPFYVRSETDVAGDHRWHGTQGPMPVRRVLGAEQHPVTEAFVQSTTALGHAYTPDKNAPDSAVGVGPVPLNIANGVRVNAAAAYLLPHLDRENLEICGDTTVVSVLFNGGKAIGVEVIRAGERSVIRADTVVLSAGSVLTPTILLRSGIGDAGQLAALDIPVVSHSPGVGSDFSDHPEVAVPYAMRAEVNGSAAVLEAVLHTGDIEIRPYTRRFDQLIEGLGTTRHTMGVGLMRPRSRGNIRLRSLDPFAAPMVNYGYLESATDRRSLTAGVAMVGQILESTPFADMIDRRLFSGDLRGHLGTSLHLSGSARMGPDSDTRAVLDERCRVRGVDGVYVIDTSAFPVVPSRGPHATAVMFAERANEFVMDTDISKGA